MKFKIASVLELVIPLSVLVVLSLSACGGGAYGTGSNAYDGQWVATAMGYTSPSYTAVAPDTVVSCRVVPALITITHGYGSGQQTMVCEGDVTGAQYGPGMYMNLGITVAPDSASGITGKVTLTTTGGGGAYPNLSAAAGGCASREWCGIPDPVKFDMWKCGSPAAAALLTATGVGC